MKTISKQSIIEKINGNYSEGSIREAILESWNSEDPLFDTSKEGSTGLDEFFAEVYPGQEINIKSRLIERLTIGNNETGEFEIMLYENYVDSGSVDYAYSFTAYQI